MIHITSNFLLVLLDRLNVHRIMATLKTDSWVTGFTSVIAVHAFDLFLFCWLTDDWLVDWLVCLHVRKLINAWGIGLSDLHVVEINYSNLKLKPNQMFSFLQKSQLLGSLVFDQLRTNSTFADRIIFLCLLVLELSWS